MIQTGRGRQAWKRAVLFSVICAVSFFASRCGPSSKPEASAPAARRFVYISPDPLGINPFLIMGQTGIESAAAKYGAESKVLESDDPTTREENVRAAIDEGYSPIVVLGFEFNDIILDLAADNPGTEFLVVDQCIADAPSNVYCAVFKEFEAAFLLGAMAASLSSSGHVGAVATADIPFLHRYTDAFRDGAQLIDPTLRFSVRWVGGENPFADPVRAKEQALDLAADGADLMFAVAAAGNAGIFEAAAEQGFRAFGIDVDQCPDAPGHIVDNLIKRVDLVIEQAIDAIVEGRGEPIMVFGLESNSLYVDALRDEAAAESECLIFAHPELRQRIRELADRIIDGDIRIDDPMGLL